VRELEVAVKEHGVRSAQAFPAGLLPQVAINDKKFYPLYAKCVELDIPIFVNAGVPGPRVPMDCQHVAHIDELHSRVAVQRACLFGGVRRHLHHGLVDQALGGLLHRRNTLM
jgi:predicted TIM-barrel fold metal-dependent hydrolase